MSVLRQRVDLEGDVHVCNYDQHQLLNRKIVILLITAVRFYELRCLKLMQTLGEFENSDCPLFTIA